MKESKIALAINAGDVDVIAEDIKRIAAANRWFSQKPVKLTEETPDERYIIFYWDYVLWEGDAVTSLLKKLEGIRHALCQITEDGEVWKDISISDGRGVDEEFSELLDIKSDIHVWGDKPIETALPPRKLLTDIVWCVDAEDIDALKCLPTQVMLPRNVDEEDAAKYLSDTYGFLVEAFTVSEAPFDENLTVPWAKFDITDEELEDFAEKEANEDISTRRVFYNSVLDDQDTEFDNLISDYRAADKNVRSVIDATLVRVCGWSLPTLLRMASEEAEKEGGAA